jgi:hypothetical protein
VTVDHSLVVILSSSSPTGLSGGSGPNLHRPLLRSIAGLVESMENSPGYSVRRRTIERHRWIVGVAERGAVSHAIGGVKIHRHSILPPGPLTAPGLTVCDTTPVRGRCSASPLSPARL